MEEYEFQLFGEIIEKADSEYANDVECYIDFMTWHFRLDLFVFNITP